MPVVHLVSWGRRWMVCVVQLEVEELEQLKAKPVQTHAATLMCNYYIT